MIGMPLPSTAERVTLSGERQTMAAFGGAFFFFPAGAAAGGTRLLVRGRSPMSWPTKPDSGKLHIPLHR